MRRTTTKKKAQTPPLRIVPLGGLGEIGKNMWIVESADDLIVLDCGLGFPTEEMPGIDCVLPSYDYVLERQDKLRGVFITHGHEDHIGGLPYFLQQVSTTVYATPFTHGLIEGKLNEPKGKLKPNKLLVMRPREIVEAGGFQVEFLRVNHSIADGVAIAVRTHAGTVLYTGDFKLDQTPMDNEMFDYLRFAQLGEEGVLALLSDSTNATREGFTPSERAVGKTLEIQFSQAKGRIIVSTFASNVHRIQQIVDVAHKLGRKVALAGRSMLRVSEQAIKHGYLIDPGDVLVDLYDLKRVRPEKVVIITTGSQGEPMSGLTRLAQGEHRSLKVEEGDTIIYSAVPIPGNERMVTRTVNKLLARGAAVLYESSRSNAALQHVSGHASAEELKIMLNLCKPKFFVPVHGELRHLMAHARLAVATGVPAERTFSLNNGSILELTPDEGKIVDQMPDTTVLIDGMGLAGIGQEVIRERQTLAKDGAMAISITVDEEGYLLEGPEIASMGFLFQAEMEALAHPIRQLVEQAVEKVRVEACHPNAGQIRRAISDRVGRLLQDKIGRRPTVIVMVHLVAGDYEEAPVKAKASTKAASTTSRN
jgi:ribonuclease J